RVIAAPLSTTWRGGLRPPAATEPAGDLADDLDVIPSACGRLERPADALHPALAVGDGAFGFRPTRGRGQHHVRHLGGLGEEDVLDDQVLEPAEKADGSRLVGLAASRVLTDYVQGAQVPMIHRLEHLAQVPALL